MNNLLHLDSSLRAEGSRTALDLGGAEDKSIADALTAIETLVA